MLTADELRKIQDKRRDGFLNKSLELIRRYASRDPNLKEFYCFPMYDRKDTKLWNEAAEKFIELGYGVDKMLYEGDMFPEKHGRLCIKVTW